MSRRGPLLVQRDATSYCLIYREMGSRHDVLAGMGDAMLAQIQGETVLSVHDPRMGECGCFEDVQWTFKNGVPVPLVFPLLPALKRLVPRGCEFRGEGDFLDLDHLTYHGPIWSKTDTEANPTCGQATIKFKIRDHEAVVTQSWFSPEPFPHH